jgi:hypothetical protein
MSVHTTIDAPPTLAAPIANIDGNSRGTVDL